MEEARFVAGRRSGWEQLDALLARVERRGLRGLNAAEVDALAIGYRAATSDLAMSRARAYDPRLTGYLNRLTARAHACVYAATSRNGWSRTADFFSSAFPREVRRSWVAVAVCVMLTVITAAFTYRATVADPANAYAFVPASSVPLVKKSLHDSNFGFDRAFSPAMSAMIITNNIRVSILAVAGGATAGIGTLVVIVTNGLDLGTIGALFARRGFGYDFWATIAPHGVIELSAIQIAGAAGLVLAGGLIRPGRLKRADALTANARRAGTLVLGVAAMLVVAGTIEGFVSPQRLPPDVRIAIGALTGILLAAYLGLAGRSGPERTPGNARLESLVGVRPHGGA